jgi:hypothetical protein
MRAARYNCDRRNLGFSVGHLVSDRNLNILGHPSELCSQTGEQFSFRFVGRELADQRTILRIRAKLLKLLFQILHAEENAQKNNGVNVQK